MADQFSSVPINFTDPTASTIKAKNKLQTTADPAKFAKLLFERLDDIKEQLYDIDNNMVEIDGVEFDKTTATGALVIEDKLAELDQGHTMNFNVLDFIGKVESKIFNMFG
ncbi:MAG: hypothetical protein ABIH39_03925 [Candidatus Margulisiibacteriota bacterium]